MAQDNPYLNVIVESFIPSNPGGLHGDVHIRPVEGGPYPTTLFVECSKKLSRDYPVGTKFQIVAKLTDRDGGGEYLYSHYRWKYKVIQG